LVYYDNAIPVLAPASNSIDLTWLDESRGVAIFIEVTVSSPQYFTATLPVSVSAYGSISDQGLRWIWDICACLSEAYAMIGNKIVQTPNEEPFAGVYLNTTNTKPAEYTAAEDFAGEYLVGSPQSIEWQNPTQTVPYIIITYKNTTKVNGIGQNVQASKPFPDKGFQIESISSTDSNRATLRYYVTDALVVGLGLVQGLLIIIDKREPKGNYRSSKRNRPGAAINRKKVRTGHQKQR